MEMVSLKDQLLDLFDKLSSEQQKQVLTFVQSLPKPLPPGMPGEELIQLAEELNFDSDELALMSEAIEEHCGRIDPDEWR
jgi:hypothetical protein